MKRVIFYFSGTGNTLVVAREFADKLGYTELVTIASLNGNSYDIMGLDVGIAFPVYSGIMPNMVTHFVESLSSSPGQYFFGICTCAGIPFGALDYLAPVLAGKGASLSLGTVLVMPSNYISFGEAPCEKKQKVLFEKASAKISETVAMIRSRSCGKIEKSFFLDKQARSFSPNCALPRRFKRTINVINSTTIKLVANCLDWAKHRRKKAAAKMHLRLDLRSFLPNFVLVKSAGTNDAKEARAVCTGISAGEIAVFDKAYVDFKHLRDLSARGVFWVTRAKDNMKYEVVGQHSVPQDNIIRDNYVALTGFYTSKWHPESFRLVEALVEVDGKLKKMTFITNNFTWSPNSICDLYKARWSIEVFFKEIKEIKEIKQTLQLADFIGNNENAVRWQIWTALRGVLWSAFDMFSVLDCCGTAGDTPRMRAAPEQCYLPGFAPGTT